MNEQIRARIEAGKGRKANSHPNKNQPSKHPVSGKRGKARS